MQPIFTTMTKELDFSKSVYELTQQYPEIVEIMRDLGFTEIVKPGMLQSAGRVMTIPKGSKMKKIPMEKGGRTMLVTYMAVRDKSRNYLGTMEIVQDMEFAKEHFSK